VSTGERARQAYQFFLEKGYSPAMAAAMTGNLQQESSFNPGALGDNRASFGIGQWQGSRRRMLEQFAAENRMPVDDMRTQLAFMDYEIRGGHDMGSDDILGYQGDDVAEATRLVSAKYFRPSAPHDENRIRNAMAVAGTPPAAPQAGLTHGTAQKAGAGLTERGTPAGLSDDLELERYRRRARLARAAGLPDLDEQDIMRLKRGDPTPEGYLRFGNTAVSGQYAGNAMLGLGQGMIAQSSQPRGPAQMIQF
jgi:hypothetical protein